jgi:hypothetical protein
MKEHQASHPFENGLNFPEKTSGEELVREHIIATISQDFSNGKNVVLIDGEEGIGKTTILRQFAEHFPANTFATFINPVRGLASPDDFVLHDLYYQFRIFVANVDDSIVSNIDEEKFLSMSYNVQREQKKRKATCYFIIDGLEFVEDELIVKKILKLIPFGIAGIRVLLSDVDNYVGSKIPHSNSIFPFSLRLFPFTVDEMKLVFGANDTLILDDWRRIWQAANNGVPGKLKDIFRILATNGYSPEELFDDLDQINTLYEIDWRKFQTINDDLLNQIAALIALDDKIYTKDYLAKLLNIDEVDVANAVGKVSFLVISANGEIQFTSNANRSFFARKLSNFKAFVDQKNIEYLLKNQETLEALIQLPKYFASSSNFDGVLNILSKDYFSKLINTAQNLSAASTSLGLGFMAAKKSGTDNKLFDFALYGSLIANVEGLHIWKSELEARIEMGDYEQAIELANSALLQEDRLRFLTRIAKIKRKRSEIIEPALLDQINHLFKSLDAKSLGKKAVEIAADLFYVNPSLALSLIQDSSSSKNQNINSWLWSKLTLAAIEAKQNVESERVSELVTGQSAKEFSYSLGELFGAYEFAQIVNEAGKLKGIKEKVLLLRLWIINNSSNVNLGAAISLALDLMVQNNSKDFADASLLADLVENLFRVKDGDQVARILDRCAQFKDEVKELSYSVDYFRFVSFAIRAKINLQYDFAMGWVFELIKDLETITDKVTQAECLALIDNLLTEVNAIVDIKRHGYLFETVNSRLKGLVLKIYESSAYHYENLKDVLFQVARFNVNFAVEMALKANTTDRRDWLLFRTLDGYIEYNLNSLKTDTIKKIFSLINDLEIQDIALQLLVQKISNEKIVNVEQSLNGFIFNRLQSVRSRQMQSYIQCLFALHLNLSKDSNLKMLNGLYSALSVNWSALDSEVEKIEIGFLISSILAEVDREIATEYLVRADDLKKTIWPDSLNTISVYTIYAQLFIKAFSGLIVTRSYDDKSFSKVIELVNAIPSPATRVILWCYLAAIAQVKRDVNLRIRIFNDFIKPTFDGLADLNQQQRIIVDYSYQFYLNNPLVTLSQLDALSKSHRETGLLNIIHFVLYERVPHEPYDTESKVFSNKLTLDDLTVICQLTAKLEIDNHIYSCIEDVVKASFDLKATPVQKEVFRQELTKIIDTKLPNQNYIKHPGFKIIAKAQLLRFEKEAKKQEASLDLLLEEIENSVPNLSDRAFIYTTISEIAPSLKGMKYTKFDFITKSLELIDLLDFSLESAYRTEVLLKRLRDTSENLWQQRLTKEFKKTITSYHNADALSLQRRLIDHAHRHDPRFAKTLINLLDNEEVRMEYRRKKHLSNYFEALRVQKDIVNDKVINEKQSGVMFAEACEGSLAALNSNKIASKKISDMRHYLEYAIKIPAKTSFDIYSYYLQNIIRKYEDKTDAGQIFQNLMDSIYNICKFIELIVQRYKLTASTNPLAKIDLSAARKKIFKPGERDFAFNFIRTWLQENEFTYVKICDPYFSPADLGILKMILEIEKKCKVYILTSVDGEYNRDPDIQEKYSFRWHDIADEDVDFVKIAVTKIRSTNVTPVHDRWIIIDKAAIHIGSSLNQLAVSKASQITELDIAEKVTVEQEIFDPLFEPKQSTFNGERVDTFSFMLQ